MKSRIFLAAAACLFLVRPVLADTRDDVIQGILRCAAIKDDRTWLNCTYGAQQPMRARLGLPPAPEFQQRLVPPSPYAAARAPAPSIPPRGAPGTAPPSYTPPPGYVLQRADQVRHEASMMDIISGTAAPIAVSPITTVKFDAAGAFWVTLANGQVWHEVGARTRAHLKVGARATITPGAMWSYNLEAEGSPKKYKVERKK
jgi:hypothetical protein